MLSNTIHELSQRSLADLVEERPGAAAVFERFGLDFCCGGQRTLEDAARTRQVSLPAVVEALSRDAERSTRTGQPSGPDLVALIEEIVGVHHRYVREITPTLNHWLDKLVARHGTGHPELASVREIFRALSDDLDTHMLKEENILFPFIRDLAAAAESGEAPAPVGTIAHPVRVMKADHRHAGDMLDQLSTLTQRYQPPEDGCTTYRSCYRELERFERDLHRHVHLENNVLFPKAVALEASLV